ncbi:MAG: Rpn family recombination-promoting nuclease/putative transposase, partial [Tannerella sp.]|nr:Rpn family recombination-promoting nuclease/putative transposase [Tannerella sp.]
MFLESRNQMNDREEIQPKDPVFLNPLTDFGFKRIFGDRELMIDFLNEVIQDVYIQNVKYKPTEQLGDWDKERKAVFDLLCTNEKGEYFLVEMQHARQRYFADRMLFYSSYLIRNQAPRKKDWNFELKAVYVVSVLDFVLAEEK